MHRTSFVSTDVICLCQISFQDFCKQAVCDSEQRVGKTVSTKEFTCIVSAAVTEAKLKTL